MEKLLAALAQPERLRILMWLISHGPARQVEILRYLESERKAPVNAGQVSLLLKPLFEVEILQRKKGPRGPVEISEREQLIRLLQAATSLSLTLSKAAPERAERESDELRRALLHQAAAAAVGT